MLAPCDISKLIFALPGVFSLDSHVVTNLSSGDVRDMCGKVHAISCYIVVAFGGARNWCVAFSADVMLNTKGCHEQFVSGLRGSLS